MAGDKGDNKTVKEKMTAIADSIRRKTGGEEPLTLDDMASGVNEVYDKGCTQGYTQAELDFWNAFTNNGARKSYYFAFFSTDFSGETIPDGLFKPRYDATYPPLYRAFLQYKGKTLPKGMDCSLITEGVNCGAMVFFNSRLTEIYDMKIPKVSSYNSWYCYCYNLITIEKIRTLKSTTYSDTFKDCNYLKDITFEGEIGQDIKFAQSASLTYETLMNIKSCLYDYSTEGGTHTLTLHATAKARLTDNDIAEIQAKGWTIVG